MKKADCPDDVADLGTAQSPLRFTLLPPEGHDSEGLQNLCFIQMNPEGSPGQAFKLTQCFNNPHLPYTHTHTHLLQVKSVATPCRAKRALLVAVIAPPPLHNSLPPLISRQPVEKRAAEVTLHWLWLVMMDCGRLCQPSRAAQPEPGGNRAAKYLHISHRCRLIMKV